MVDIGPEIPGLSCPRAIQVRNFSNQRASESLRASEGLKKVSEGLMPSWGLREPLRGASEGSRPETNQQP